MSQSAMRDYAASDMTPAVKGRVELHEGETEHFEVHADGSISISVVTDSHAVPIEALLVGGFGHGVWWIPAIGTEVIVVFPDGDFEGDAIAYPLANGSPLGLAAGKVVIVGSEVLVHNGSSGAGALPTLAEFNNHTHPTGTGPSGIPSTPAVGTTVLRAK